MTVLHPAIASYVERIGAEQLNFKRFIVRTYKTHYYRERASITLNADGTVSAPEEFAPTPEEAVAIAEAILSSSFPKSILATDAQVRWLRGSGKIEGELFAFCDLARTGIIMCQERKERDGMKMYLPWTFFSDGEWRMMEPDGALPLWKPKEAPAKAALMIHEGAKTAARVTDLIESGKWRQHPWGEELKEYEHWGMIGGALAPHRSDYEEIRRRRAIQVVYVCDNDPQGKAAATTVSRMFGQSMKAVMFDDSFPHAWDMADPMPSKLYTARGVYSGPRLSDFSIPATWATERVKSHDGKKMVYAIRSEFAQEWYHTVLPEVFVNIHMTHRMLTEKEFNNWVRPFSNVDETAKLLKADITSKAVEIRYDPSKAGGTYADAGGTYINAYLGPPIKPRKGDARRFEEYMEHLVPDETDRRELLRWCATLIARPGTKMTYGVLLISENQGVGKTTLGEQILSRLVGRENSTSPSETDIVDSSFNYWCAHKRLVVINEIYQGHSSAAYNRLKSIITDDTILVRKKYVAPYPIANWVHVFACSNDPRAIKLSVDDRRWLVPKVTERQWEKQNWVDLYEWLEDGGLETIAAWAEDYIREHGEVRKGEHAPYTATKRVVIEENYGPGQRLVAEYLDKAKQKINGHAFVTTDVALQRALLHHVYGGRADRLDRLLTIRKTAQGLDLHVGERRLDLRDRGINNRSRLISSDPALVRLDAEGLRRALDEGVHMLDPVSEILVWELVSDHL